MSVGVATPALVPSTPAHSTTFERWATIGLMGGAFLAALAGVTVIRRYPVVFLDEPWYANASWQLATRGTNFDSMFTGVLDQWPASWVRWPWLGNVPFAAAFAVGGLGLFQARLTSWIFGLVLLWLVFLVGRRLYSGVTGALAAFLLSVSSVFLQASHYIRVDMFLACTVLAALYLLVVGVDNARPRLVFLAGLVSSVSVDIHMNGALFGIGLAVVLLVLTRSRSLGWNYLGSLAAGAAVGTVYWTIVHIAPSPTTYFAIARGWQGSILQPPIAGLSLAALIESLRAEVGRYRFYSNGLDFALIGASLLVLLSRRTASDRVLLTFIGTSFVLFVLAVQNKHDIYAILFYPLFLLAVAETFVHLWRHRGEAGVGRFAGALLILLIVNSAVHVIRPVAQTRGYDYEALTARMRRAIPAGARVAGMPTWWFGFSDYDYRSLLGLTYYHLFNGHDVLEGLEAMHPTHVIMDGDFDLLLVDDEGFPPGPGFAMYQLPRHQFEAFMATHGRKIDELVDRWHGRIAIYEIAWQTPAPRTGS